MKTYDNLGLMIDCSRNGVMNIGSLKKMIDITSQMGYTFIQLYTEDTYEVNNQPYFGYKRGRYSKKELKELDTYAKAHGMELIPCIQALAHLNCIFRWKEYWEVHDCSDILFANEDKTYLLLEDIFATLAEVFTSRRVHIGMDEAEMVGLGKYLKKYGYSDRFEILCRHLEKVVAIAKRYGFEPMMWADMFFKLLNNSNDYHCDVALTEEQKKIIPEGLELVYWDYYSTDKNHYDKAIKSHRQFDRNIWFAGGGWTWTGFCPNTKYAIEASKIAVRSCIEHGVKDMFLTLWGDNGRECSPYAALPVIYAFAEYAKGNFDEALIAQNFKRMFNVDYDDFISLCEPDMLVLADGPRNPSKYMLYNDPFLGIYDLTYVEGAEKKYGGLKRKYDMISKTAGDYAYIFECESELCNVLELKYGLGVKTRKLYAENNLKALKQIAETDYTVLVTRINDFVDKLRKLWEKDNKPYGFEVQDARLGGLCMRILTCKKRLLEYVCGKTDKIEELEEPVLPLSTAYKEGQLMDNKWCDYISACPV